MSTPQIVTLKAIADAASELPKLPDNTREEMLGALEKGDLEALMRQLGALYGK